jgi:lipopolysaccharide/colanic/teichoic acid biosynthesis glycosyltransferase
MTFPLRFLSARLSHGADRTPGTGAVFGAAERPAPARLPGAEMLVIVLCTMAAVTIGGPDCQGSAGSLGLAVSAAFATPPFHHWTGLFEAGELWRPTLRAGRVAAGLLVVMALLTPWLLLAPESCFGAGTLAGSALLAFSLLLIVRIAALQAGLQHAGRRRALLKGAVDRTLSLATLALTLPMIVGIALAIRRESPGPVLVARPRVGADGLLFDQLAFRTTSTNGATTRVGAFLRRTGLARLPLLVNVLRGDMSLVGPAAAPADANGSGRPVAGGHRRRLKPGLVSLAHVRGDGAVRSTARRARRQRALDRLYAARWSVGLDVAILLEAALLLAIGGDTD